MPTLRIVKPFHVVKQICLRVVARTIVPSVHSLDLQAGEETLHHGVVPDVAQAAHAADNAVLVEQSLELLAGVLGDFQRSSQHLINGGVVWDDRQDGLRSGQDGHRCGRQAGVNQREAEQAFWVRIAAGAPSEDAALARGVSQPVGTRWFREAGGMAPVSLAACSRRYLLFAEREELALLKAQGLAVCEIARRIGRSPSTVSRELRRNATTRGGVLHYRATVAQWKAERFASRPKTAKLTQNERLRADVQDRLAGLVADTRGKPIPGPRVPWKGRRHGRRADRRWGKCWSPQQISRRLSIDFPHDETMRISHEAIYQALYVQGRGALRRELSACLRTGRSLRVPRARTRQRGKSFITPEVMISQ